MIPGNILPNSILRDGGWCIAGGWAACPALAGDMDLWVYGIERDQLVEMQIALRVHLEDRFGSALFNPSFESTTCGPTEYENDAIAILKVGTIGFVKPVHIMVCDAPRPEDILDAFDVSTHQVAILPSGQVITGPGFTGPHEPPVALRNNGNTAERLTRIAMRFGHTTLSIEPPEGCPF